MAAFAPGPSAAVPLASSSVPAPTATSPDDAAVPDGSSPSHLFDESDDECLFVRTHPPGQKPSFVWVCLGVGGGPLENDCSCYMVKPADRHWREGTYVVEGGSWLGALSRVCEDQTPGKISAFHDFDFSHTNASLRAGEIGSYAKAFLISHAHLDHILGLVLGCASLPGKRAVYGLKSTLENLLNIFDGKLWPKLASFKEDAPFIVYHLRPVECQVTLHLDDVLSTIPFSLSHGLSSATVPAPPTPTQFQSASSGPASYFGKRYSLPLNSLATNVGPGGRSMPSRAIEASAAFLAGGGPKGTKPMFTSPFAPDRHPDSLDSSDETATGASSMQISSSSPPRLQGVVQPLYIDGSGSVSDRSSGGIDPSQTYTGFSSTIGRQTNAPAPTSPTATSGGFRKSPLSLLSSARRPKTAVGTEKHPAQNILVSPSSSSELQATASTAPIPLLRSRSRSSVNNPLQSQPQPQPQQEQESHSHHYPSALQPSSASHAPVHSAAPITRSGKAGFREAAPRRLSLDRHPPTMDSTAFFLTNKKTKMDVLFFGDVEPDCISRSPRNKKVWSYAASRFARGKLNAIFLECSFPAAQPVEFLWGHLSTNHLVDELVVLARFVKLERAAMEKDCARERDRQKTSVDGGSRDGGSGGEPTAAAMAPSTSEPTAVKDPSSFDFGFFSGSQSDSLPAEQRLPSTGSGGESDLLSSLPVSSLSLAGPQPSGEVKTEDLRDVLKGLTVIVVHVKQALFPSYADAAPEAPRAPEEGQNTKEHEKHGSGDGGDGGGGGGGGGVADKENKAKVLDPRTMQVRLLQELREREAETGMGVRFVMSKQGMRIEM